MADTGNTHSRQDESRAVQLVKKLLDYGIDGVGPLSNASDLAQEYVIDRSYEDHDERVDSLIRWEAAKNFTSGFLTGFGDRLRLTGNKQP